MTKREEIDQLRHDYSMLARRLEVVEQRVTELMTAAERKKPDPFEVIGPGLPNVQKIVQDAWNAGNNKLLNQAPKINDHTQSALVTLRPAPTPKFIHPRRGVST